MWHITSVARRAALARAALARAAFAVVGAGLGVGPAACAVGVEGDFDGVPFDPGPTVMAVADRNDLSVQNGAVLPVGRADDDERLHVLFTAASLDTDRHWLGMSGTALGDITRALATSDGLLLLDVPLGRFADGERLSAVLEDGRLSGDFAFAVGMAWPEAETARDQAIGSKIRLALEPRGLELSRRGGSIAADITITREREAGQGGDVATGRFTLRFSAGLKPERLTEANLAVAIPVLQCMQALGPGRAATCAHARPLPVVDETGRVD